MVIGGGLGAITGLFVPGGPIVGGILGAGAGLVSGSSALKDYLFGKLEPEYDDEGKPIPGSEKRNGGLISKQVMDGVKKYGPRAGIGALLGKTLIGGLLPGGLGQVVGTLFGALGGAATASDEFKKILFGDGDHL